MRGCLDKTHNRSLTRLKNIVSCAHGTCYWVEEAENKNRCLGVLSTRTWFSQFTNFSWQYKANRKWKHFQWFESIFKFNAAVQLWYILRFSSPDREVRKLKHIQTIYPLILLRQDISNNFWTKCLEMDLMRVPGKMHQMCDNNCPSCGGKESGFLRSLRLGMLHEYKVNFRPIDAYLTYRKFSCTFRNWQSFGFIIYKNISCYFIKHKVDYIELGLPFKVTQRTV